MSCIVQVSSRDSRLEELEQRLEQMSHADAASELDTLAASPIAALHSSVTVLTNAIKVSILIWINTEPQFVCCSFSGVSVP